MGRFVNMTATDSITLRNGDQVQVRQMLSAEEAANLKKNLIRFEYKATEDGSSQVIATGGEWYRQRIEICQAYLVDWDFTDDAGQKVTYNPDLVASLTEDTVDEIAEGIDGLQAARREQFTKKEIPSSAR